MTTFQIPADRAARHGGADFFRGGDKFAETFEIWGKLTPNDTVLDIGCGPGRMAIAIGERFNWSNSLLGFDIIEQDVKICQDVISSQYPNFAFQHINAWNGHYNPKGTIKPYEVEFPCDSNAIDFAFATSVFTHMYFKESKHYIDECFRVLKTGGRLLSSWFSISEATNSSRHARWKFEHLLEDGTYTDRPERPEDVIGFRYDDILNLFENAGFNHVEFYQGDWAKIVDKSTVRHGQDVFVCWK